MLQILRPHFGKLSRFLLLGILTGLGSFVFLMLVNLFVGMIIAGQYDSVQLEYVLAFAIVLVLFIWSRRTLAVSIVEFSQQLFWQLRNEIIVLVLKSPYQELKGKRDKVHSALIRDVGALTNASLSIIDFITAIVVVVACFIQMASLSFPLFAVTVTIAVAGVLIYQFASVRNNARFEKSRDLEDKFMFHFNSILNGAKEIKMDAKKGKRIYNTRVMPIADESYRNNAKAYVGFVNSMMIGQVMFYVLIASILLFFSVWLETEAAVTISFLFILLFVLGSIETIMVLLPSIVVANVSAKRIVGLREELRANEMEQILQVDSVVKDDFSTLRIKDLTFSYSTDKGAFGIGPVNLELNKGETVFIYGGNGSGKTTTVHSILGLLMPQSGSVSFNGVELTDENIISYRSMFGVVFSDFHLFEEMYGVDVVDVPRLQRYLEMFEINDKVEVKDGKFSTLDLSTGQRKRLALINALIENKPILVLDEWAADQDPYFRKKFYTEIIPLLNKEHFTILAVTHDDHYYRCADKLFRMDYGRLVEDATLAAVQESVPVL
jgi:putative ATP-binding cassette transporter